MPLEEIGAILLFLVVVFLLGNLWFHFIETILKWLKRDLHAAKNLPHGIRSHRTRRTE